MSTRVSAYSFQSLITFEPLNNRNVDSLRLRTMTVANMLKSRSEEVPKKSIYEDFVQNNHHLFRRGNVDMKKKKNNIQSSV